MHPPSDTTLVNLLKKGDSGKAAQEIWERYFQRLAALARTKLTEGARRVSDEEDVALSAFDSFFRGAAKGRFPRLEDGHDLWQVLVLLAERKAINHLRRHLAAKRGGHLVSHWPDANVGDSSAPLGLDQLTDPQPTPEFVALFNDECRRLLAALPEPELREVALLKMEGYTCAEIGKSLDRAPRSIERKLHAIRTVWERLVDD